MTNSLSVVASTLSLFLGLPALAQSPLWANPQSQPGTDPYAIAPTAQPAQTPADATTIPAVQMVADFKDSDVKFHLDELVDILRDRRHEGWVLAAYPDPRTSQPLIGAGFSLDLPEREHPQTDPLNPHPFLEPSSADLWQAAGFDPARLDDILSVFYERRRTWSKRTWRRQLFSLPAQISDEDATELVRVGAIQAIYNARGYCRNFDQLTGPQQMAMAQLVYQMGVNLQHFNEFLGTINSGAQSSGTQSSVAGPAQDPQEAAMESSAFGMAASAEPASWDQTPEYWQGVQKSLIGSQWAHKYRTRAIAVIAMLDPAYEDDPSAAEQRVSAELRPSAAPRRHGHAPVAIQQAAASTHHRHAAKRRAARARNKRRT